MNYPLYSYFSAILNINFLLGGKQEFLSLKEFLVSKYKEKVTVEGVSDIGVTGNFDVILLNTVPNKLLHSKKQFRQGTCKTDIERSQILKSIDSYLECQ